MRGSRADPRPADAAPPDVATGDIYRGAIPFVLMQVVAVATVFFFPALATWLPENMRQVPGG